MDPKTEIPPEFRILDVGAILARVRGGERFAENLQLTARVLVEFMQEHGLTTRRILAPSEAMPAEFAILRGDLTEEGLEFYKQAELRWMTAHDRGTSITDTRILVSIARKLRNVS